MQWSPLILHQEVVEDEVDNVDQQAVALDAPQNLIARHTREGDTAADVVSEACSSNPPCTWRTGTEKLRNNSTERKMQLKESSRGKWKMNIKSHCNLCHKHGGY